MKKVLAILLIVGSFTGLNAQDETVNGNLTVKKRVKWGNTGAVLNTDQGASIELRGTGIPYFDFSNDPTTDYDMRLILRNNNELRVDGGDLSLSNRLRWGSTGAILNTDQGASIELRGTGVPYFDFSNDPTTDYDMRLILRDNNTLGVSGGNLAVDGKLKAKEVNVQTNVWADYVFDKDYNLPSLEEVEAHIIQKGHLLDIPNQEEVLQNGINLGKMNTKLLQKIEELTLYIIQQNKEVESLKKQNTMLLSLSQRLTQIEDKLKTETPTINNNKN